MSAASTQATASVSVLPPSSVTGSVMSEASQSVTSNPADTSLPSGLLPPTPAPSGGSTTGSTATGSSASTTAVVMYATIGILIILLGSLIIYRSRRKLNPSRKPRSSPDQEPVSPLISHAAAIAMVPLGRQSSDDGIGLVSFRQQTLPPDSSSQAHAQVQAQDPSSVSRASAIAVEPTIVSVPSTLTEERLTSATAQSDIITEPSPATESDEKFILFVAMSAYHPTADDELEINTGDIIGIRNGDTTKSRMKGVNTTTTKTGFFPGRLLTSSLSATGTESAGSVVSSRAYQQSVEPNQPDSQDSAHASRYIVSVPFQSQRPDEITLRSHDTVQVRHWFEDGWVYGTNEATAQSGIFPSTYLQPLDPVDAPPEYSESGQRSPPGNKL
ncbi:uncharacterized protein BJ171DRAFT_542073 [Polychytrium aggregatum]|uniref:uncharacterized protein n=1 Tax=Polychytrium aggregatum TaxID=110093 RepID=UPI0022FE5593|nr:uncharacterized protein BJ171DRAFT_542073 [Polychytrium aggregatum]KAI9190697.1 hypothetical protein BJ171DRAFT_542073 [Polychytrium aggregatum]